MHKLIVVLILLIRWSISDAQLVTDSKTFGKYTVNTYSDRNVKLYSESKLLLTIPFDKDQEGEPDVFMEDVDFDGDYDLFVSTMCGSNCSYDIYTNFKNNFAFNKDVSSIAFFSDYYFDKTNKIFYFFEHGSAVQRKIKFYKWEGPKIIFYKEIIEDGTKGDGYYDVTSKEMVEGKWIIKKYREKISE